MDPIQSRIGLARGSSKARSPLGLPVRGVGSSAPERANDHVRSWPKAPVCGCFCKPFTSTSRVTNCPSGGIPQPWTSQGKRFMTFLASLDSGLIPSAWANAWRHCIPSRKLWRSEPVWKRRFMQFEMETGFSSRLSNLGLMATP